MQSSCSTADFQDLRAIPLRFRRRLGQPKRDKQYAPLLKWHSFVLKRAGQVGGPAARPCAALLRGPAQDCFVLKLRQSLRQFVEASQVLLKLEADGR
eukprot:4478945-Pleurochrysis_carterae.AAC.2